MNQNTGTFIKKLANYILVTFKEPGILSRAVAELEDPNILMRAELPNRINIMTEIGITQVQRRINLKKDCDKTDCWQSRPRRYMYKKWASLERKEVYSRQTWLSCGE